MNFRNWTLAGVVVCMLGSSASAVTVSSAVASSSYGDRTPDKTYDGSGLSGGFHDTIQSNMWLATDGTDVGSYIIWTLDQNYSLTGFHLWNYNEAGGQTDRGINFATIDISTSSDFTTGVTTISGAEFLIANGGSDPGADYTLSGLSAGAVSAAVGKYVRFTTEAAFNVDETFIGLSEIQFAGTAVPTPEPTSICLLICGALGMLAVRRRCRSKVA